MMHAKKVSLADVARRSGVSLATVSRVLSGAKYPIAEKTQAKVLQAAGRIIRTPSDRGALLLIDQRYTQAEYLSLLPAQWSIRRVRNASQLTTGLREFWNEPTEIPDQTE